MMDNSYLIYADFVKIYLQRSDFTLQTCKKMTAINMVLPKWWPTEVIERLYFNFTFVLLLGRRFSKSTTSAIPRRWWQADTLKISTMPDKSEKERRKQIMDDLKIKADQKFESALPMSRELFQKLFDYLNTELTEKDCDNSISLTKIFLLQSNIKNVEEVLEWFAEYGGYCDCEILDNVEEKFE